MQNKGAPGEPHSWQDGEPTGINSFDILVNFVTNSERNGKNGSEHVATEAAAAQPLLSITSLSLAHTHMFAIVLAALAIVAYAQQTYQCSGGNCPQTINCNPCGDCYVECNGPNACKGMTINCPGDHVCSVNCGFGGSGPIPSATYACAGMTINMPTCPKGMSLDHLFVCVQGGVNGILARLHLDVLLCSRL
jgi:hypothetical protein